MHIYIISPLICLKTSIECKCVCLVYLLLYSVSIITVMVNKRLPMQASGYDVKTLTERVK